MVLQYEYSGVYGDADEYGVILKLRLMRVQRSHSVRETVSLEAARLLLTRKYSGCRRLDSIRVLKVFRAAVGKKID